jgi:ATP adenylyltransferase
MKFLPAPWRWPLITGLKKSEKCFFCQAPKQDDRDSLICKRGGKFFVLLNRYPYTSGHLLVAPYEHVDSPEKMDTAASGEMWELATSAPRDSISD